MDLLRPPAVVLPVIPCSFRLSVNHWIGVRRPMSSPCKLPHPNLVHLMHSTECTQHSLPQRPRRGELVAVAKSLSRFRLAETSCFRLDAIAGALLVIAPNAVPRHVLCLPIPILSHLHPCCSCASTAIRWEEARLRRRHVSATACIDNDQRETRQRYTDRPDDIAVSAFSVAQVRPAIYQPQT